MPPDRLVILECARRLGLTTARRASGPHRGRVDDVLVTLEITRERLHVLAHGRFPHELAIEYETAGTRILATLGAGDLQTGDAGFDRKVRVRAPHEPERVMAALAQRTRRALLGLLAAGGRIHENTLHVENPESPDEAPVLVDLVREAAFVARELSVTAQEAPGKLFDNTFDVEAGVRLASLHVLLRSFPDHADTARAAETCLNDADPEVRRVAREAEQSGERGKVALLRIATASDAGHFARITALERILDRDPARRMTDMLVEAAASLDDVLPAAIRGARNPSVAVLERLAGGEEVPAGVRRAARDRLGRGEDPATVGRLSIAEPANRGALSPASEGGGLSLPDDDRRRRKPRR